MKYRYKIKATGIANDGFRFPMEFEFWCAYGSRHLKFREELSDNMRRRGYPIFTLESVRRLPVKSVSKAILRPL